MKKNRNTTEDIIEDTINFGEKYYNRKYNKYEKYMIRAIIRGEH